MSETDELTHELKDDTRAMPPAPEDAAALEFDLLLREGFELLEDLTSASPGCFSGLYQAWYDRAHAVVAQLAPSRVGELERLYRDNKRRRIDLETYGIEDYLLGVSLHGGFGQLDAMRAVAARRFHLQILLLKAQHHRLDGHLHDLGAAVVGHIARRLVARAGTMLDAQRHELAHALLVEAAVELLAQRAATGKAATPRGRRLSKPDGSDGLAALVAALPTAARESERWSRFQALALDPLPLPAEVAEARDILASLL